MSKSNIDKAAERLRKAIKHKKLPDRLLRKESKL